MRKITFTSPNHPAPLPTSYTGMKLCNLTMQKFITVTQKSQQPATQKLLIILISTCVNVPLVLVAMSATFWKASRNTAAANTVVLRESKQQNIYSHQRQSWLGTATEHLKINLIHILRMQIKAMSRIKCMMWTWLHEVHETSGCPICWFRRVLIRHLFDPTLVQTITHAAKCRLHRVPFGTGPKASINIFKKMKEITNKRLLRC